MQQNLTASQLLKMPCSDTTAAAVSTNTPATKMERIFAIAELLEHVLACLSVQDLLLAQRVCKKWKVTIEKSPRLQQCLFFQPRSPFDTTAKPAHREQFEHNSLLEAKFELFFHNLSLVQPSTRSRVHYDAIPWNQSFESQRAYTRAEASWRKMLILQPPPQRIAIFRKCSGFRGARQQVADLNHRDFSRMGWIYDRCSEACLGNARGSFDLSWDDTPDNTKTESGVIAEPTLTLKFYHYVTCGAMDFEPESRDDRHLMSEAYSPFDITWREVPWVYTLLD